MQRTSTTPVSRGGALAALGGSMLVVASMFMPWVESGPTGQLDYWHLTSVGAVAHDLRTYELSVTLMLLLAAWSALYFVWRSRETRLAWAFGGFSGAMLLYGGDLRISEELPAGSLGTGELVAALGLFLLATGFVLAVAGNIAETQRAAVPYHTRYVTHSKQRL